MFLLLRLLAAALTYEAVRYAGRLRNRDALWHAARRAADRRGKPLLVVGAPRAWNQFWATHARGDVTCDLVPTDPATAACDLDRALPFPDKAFGAVFVSYVLEYVERPAEAVAELARVADEVFIAHLTPSEIATWTLPLVRWVILRAPPDGALAFRPRYTAAVARGTP